MEVEGHNGELDIHPTALVSPHARLGAGVRVGPCAIVEAGVVLGEGCEIAAHVQLLGDLEMGAHCKVGPGAVLGGLPQDKSYRPEFRSALCIGEENDIREHVTIHRSALDGGVTRVGEANFFMVGSHVGHDCVIGKGNTLANHCLLGGHVQLGDGIFMGGAVGVHQFVRIGDRVMVQGHAGLSLDVPPFVTAGENNLIFGLNVVGLRRAGIAPEDRAEIKRLYQAFYREDHALSGALEWARARSWGNEAAKFLAFIEGDSHKGLCVRTG